jgi:hypothetical protein
MDWIEYKGEETKQSLTEGSYLVANRDTNPIFQACSYYHPIHGWSGVGHVLERLIAYIAPYPPCPSSKLS